MKILINSFNSHNLISNKISQEQSNKKYRNLLPLDSDTVSFSGNVDLMNLPAKKIIDLCSQAINSGIHIGEGKEAIVYKIEQFPEYCVRQEKKYKSSGFQLSKTLNEYDELNHVVARLDEGTTIMKYIPGIPVRFLKINDPLNSLKVKIMDLVANRFDSGSFLKALDQIEEAKLRGIDFDRCSIHVDPLNQEIICLNFNSKPKCEFSEYNPISCIYDAFDVDNTQYSTRIFGKLCQAYVQRVLSTTLEKLNLDKLDLNFYHRESNPFKHFPAPEILSDTTQKLRLLIQAKRDNLPQRQMQKIADEINKYLDNEVLSSHSDYFLY